MKSDQEYDSLAETKEEEDEQSQPAITELVKNINRLTISEMDEETISSLIAFHDDDPAQRYPVLIIFLERMRREFSGAKTRQLLLQAADESALFRERHGLLQTQFLEKYDFKTCVNPFLESSLQESCLALPNLLVLLEICAFAFSIASPLPANQLT